MAPTIVDEKVSQDGDEIDLNSDNEDQTTKEKETNEKAASTTAKTSKKSKLQERLRKLKLKINQTKQMNHQQVIQEGERLSSKEAFQKHKKQTLKNDTKQKEQEQWENVHEKNVSTLLRDSGATTTSSIHGKKKEIMALTQSGNDSIRQTFKKNEKKEKSQYSTNDYYNPEGQLRNYERSLKTIHGSGSSNSNSNSTNHYHSSSLSSNEYNNQSAQDTLFQRERSGAKRLADELKRRAAKAEKRKQKEMDFEGADVSYINKRNKHFNEKINRNYDKHTAEIRQNLERGTAL